MSEKRFDNIEISEKIVAFYDNGEFTVLDENGLGKLLNRLHRENIYLSKIRENQQQMILKLSEANEQLLKKNKILKEDVNDYHNALFDLHKKYDKLEKENEQLKQEIKQYWKCRDKWKQEAKELKEENELLRTQLLICQQSKNDDGRFQVWEVPPITMGKRISFTTNNNGGDE